MDTSENTHLYEFDGFRIEVGQKCLWYGDELIPLTTKAFDTLLVLVENNGRLVEKEALLNLVWPDTFVEEATLAQNISTLRKMFASQENGMQFIETVPKRGYRFARTVRQIEEEDDAYLIETRRSTRVIAEKTEIHATDPPAILPFSLRYKRHQKQLIVGAILSVTVLAGAFFLFREFRDPGAGVFSRIETSSLISSGDISKMAVSPDGKYIAIINNRNGLQSLRVRQTNNASTVELNPPSGDDYIGLTFSPSGDSIFYSVYKKTGENDSAAKRGVLYRIPVLGGPRIEILDDIDSPPAISPDGVKVAFIRQVPAERRSTLIIRPIEQGKSGEQILATRPMKERFSPTTVAWEPDGKKIAAVVFGGQIPEYPMDIVTIAIDTGEVVKLTSEPWMWIGQISWLRDGTGILFPAYSSGSPNITDEIWLVTVADGKTRRITNGINGVFGIAAMADSRSIAAVRSNRVTGLWISSMENPVEAVNIDKSFGDDSQGALGIDWTPSGKIIYSTAANGNADVWMVDSDGSNRRQLTDDPHADFGPVASAAGDFFVFLSNRSGSNGIWRMNIDGSGLKELAKLRDAASLSISPDGLWVYFSAAENKNRTSVLWKVSSNGGEPIQLTTRACFFPQVSPDGKQIVCYYPQQTESGEFTYKIRPTIISADGEHVEKQFNDLVIESTIPLFWMNDGTGFSYVRTLNDVSNIWVQKISGGPPFKVTDFRTDRIFRFRWSHDGKSLAFEKGLEINDIFLIRDMGR